MDILPDLAALSDAEENALITRLEDREQSLSALRKRYHERIDALRAAREKRLRARIALGTVTVVGAGPLERSLFRGSGELPERDLEALPEPETLTDDALLTLLRTLEAEEDDVSFRRREAQGHLDIVRAHRRGEPVDLASLPAVLVAPRPLQGDAA
ncbi:MAG: hypothetical protein EXQ77_02430 [Thermoleophilia bacterium]|nr:hypothetical protein [Thermoleophilia bacterium]